MATPVGPNVITEHHVKFLQSRGYKVANVSEATSFVAKMSDKERAGFFADAAAWKEPVPGMPSGPDSDEGEETAEERAARPAKEFKVLRNLRHNEKDHKAGTIVGEEAFTPEQVKILVNLKTIEEVTPESEKKADMDKVESAAAAGVRAIAQLFALDSKQMGELHDVIAEHLASV